MKCKFEGFKEKELVTVMLRLIRVFDCSSNIVRDIFVFFQLLNIHYFSIITTVNRNWKENVMSKSHWCKVLIEGSHNLH